MKEEVNIKTSCDQCYCPCGVIVKRVGGVVTKIDGDPTSHQNLGRVCAKGHSAIMSYYNPNHIKKPLKRTNPEKGLGVDPKFVEISWDEAMDTIVEKLKKVREDDPKKLIFSTFDTGVILEAFAWIISFGASPYTNWYTATYFCGSGLHQYTYLTNASFHSYPDLEYCNYLILVGSGHGFGVGCNPNISSQKMADARMRGMKVIVIDPMCSHAAAKANEWIPIVPGTDGAMAMAMLNVLLNEKGIYDREFLKKQSNAPYLVRPDGRYARDKKTKKPLIWDPGENIAKPYDVPISDYVIEGEKTYKVDGEECRPAFQLLKEHVREWSCEKASEITTIPAETIRRLAEEYGEAARIGSTIVIDGEELPYRPAANNQYRGAYSHKHGGQSALAWKGSLFHTS
ncbi:MAG: molybdopterin-dependent oxidoreductase [Thermodesulfobacteriota bacterium]|nr:molybdopterin-dependent oxidoreductase [Thermodesulfobacteriota bacterium]